MYCRRGVWLWFDECSSKQSSWNDQITAEVKCDSCLLYSFLLEISPFFVVDWIDSLFSYLLYTPKMTPYGILRVEMSPNFNGIYELLLGNVCLVCFVLFSDLVYPHLSGLVSLIFFNRQR